MQNMNSAIYELLHRKDVWCVWARPWYQYQYQYH